MKLARCIVGFNDLSYEFILAKGQVYLLEDDGSCYYQVYSLSKGYIGCFLQYRFKILPELEILSILYE